jgi:tRNA(Glu) U13 pseudouridine synthase TruD
VGSVIRDGTSNELAVIDVAFAFDLDAGSFATVLMRELTKSDAVLFSGKR